MKNKIIFWPLPYGEEVFSNFRILSLKNSSLIFIMLEASLQYITIALK